MQPGLRFRIRTWNAKRKHRRRARRRRQGVRSYPHGFCVMGILRNEALNIREWVAHYRDEGAEKIFLIDNGSDDGSLDRVADAVAEGLVETLSLPEHHRQIRHYWTAFVHFGIARRCRWMLVADLDEFWFCPDGTRLDDALAGYDDYDVIYANWSQFGTAGHIAHPASLRVDLTRRKPALGPNDCKKYIVRTSVPRKAFDLNLHTVSGADSARTLSDNQKFRINHYQVQSRRFWTEVKMCRGDADRFDQDRARKLDVLEDFDRACAVTDRTLADRVAAAAPRKAG